MNYLPKTIATLLESAFNRYLAMGGESQQRLSEMQGKLIEVVIRELNLSLLFSVDDQKVSVLTEKPETIDCSIESTILSLLQLAVSPGSNENMFSEQFEMHGDIETGKQFQEVLKNVDIDWEEILSKYTGDVVAHQIGNGARTLKKWGEGAAERLGKDVAEYLQEESRELPAQIEVDDFINQVDELRLAVDRAEARLKKLVTRDNEEQKP